MDTIQSSSTPGDLSAVARHALGEVLVACNAPAPGADVEFADVSKVVRTRYAVEGLGAASFAAVGLGVDRLWRLRGGSAQKVRVDLTKAALALRASRYLRVGGRDLGKDFKDPYTGYYATQDNRSIFLHCNFEPARRANLGVLGASLDTVDIARRVAEWPAFSLEEAMFEAGGCGAVVRTPAEWSLLPQAISARSEPLVRVEQIGDAPPEPLGPVARPLAGLRALDLTRVIAGPSCTRVFVEHGADVLKITRPGLPSSGVLDIETGIGKRSAQLDLRKAEEAEILRGLLREADVFCQAYRPGSLDARGFSAAAAAELRPGIVCVSLNAWGETGPWRSRRGYDTVVQAACGMSWVQGQGGKPAQQPVSALDYIGGNLMAAGVLEALAKRCVEGGSWRVHVSLARVAQWLIDAGLCHENALEPVADDPPETYIETLTRTMDSPMGTLRYLAPVLELSEVPPMLNAPPLPLGSSPARWWSTS